MTIAGNHEPQEQAPAAQPQGSREPPREPFWDFKASHWVTASLTIALVFVGVSQFCVYRRQAEIMSRQAEIMVQQTGIQDVQRRISEVVERPWIAIETISLTTSLTFKNGIGEIDIIFGLKNTGHIPATNVLSKGSFFVRSLVPTELGKVWSNCDDFRKIPLELRWSGIAIFPDQRQELRARFKMLPEDVKRLQSEKSVVSTLAGCIDYSFAGETTRHQTRFVYEIDKKGPTGAVAMLDPTEEEVEIPNVMINLNPLLAGNPD